MKFSCKVGDTRNQHLYVSRLYKRQERQIVAFENFRKKLVKEWAQEHCIKLVKYYDVGVAATLNTPSFPMYSPYDFSSDVAILGGSV